MRIHGAIIVGIWVVVAALLAPIADTEEANAFRPLSGAEANLSPRQSEIQNVVLLPTPPRRLSPARPESIAETPPAIAALQPKSAADLTSHFAPLVPGGSARNIASEIVPMTRPRADAMPSSIPALGKVATTPETLAIGAGSLGDNLIPDAATVADGRVLLRVLEQGAGPTIEIAWPEGTDARSRLYERLRNCFGMEVAMMDSHGQLFGLNDPISSPWRIDRDRYSSFVRDAGATATAGERDLASAIRRRHGGLSSARIVRVFPRNMDAVLLGGIRKLSGQEYESARMIHAGYELSAGELLVSNVSVDGSQSRGNISMVLASTC